MDSKKQYVPGKKKEMAQSKSYSVNTFSILYIFNSFYDKIKKKKPMKTFRLLVQVRETTPSFKRRRLERNSSHFVQEEASRIREGPTYQTDIGTKDTNDFDLVPPPPFSVSVNTNYIFFDLETTGLSRTCDITQISAVCGEKVFDKYITPNQSISPQASEVTGLKMINGELCYKGSPVKATSQYAALVDFTNFVENCSSDNKKAVLVGHNIKMFDVPVLYNALCKNNMVNEFSSHISGCIDTLLVSKQVIKKDEVDNYKQVTLVKKYLNKDYEVHNALCDVKLLKELHNEVLLEKYDVYSNIFTLSSHRLRQSLNVLVQNKAVSAAVATKMAKSGLGLTQLKLVHDRDPENGIRNLFKEPLSDNKVRITKNSKTISKVVAYFVK